MITRRCLLPSVTYYHLSLPHLDRSLYNGVDVQSFIHFVKLSTPFVNYAPAILVCLFFNHRRRDLSEPNVGESHRVTCGAALPILTPCAADVPVVDHNNGGSH